MKRAARPGSRARWRLRLLSVVAAGLAIGLAASFGRVDPEAGARRHVVAIRGFAFAPAALRVAPGDTIVWMNRDAVPHTATARDGRWDSGVLGAGESWVQVVRATDASAYVCTLHPAMTGRLIVE